MLEVSYTGQLKKILNYVIGNYIGKRECHVSPDWLLIYRIEENRLVLYRTGTHADSFK